ncbi:conjugal transfer protein TraD [Fusobacterium sp.]|uniref:conjugal transfer protein TraD n=1 Tax=Fusobacterium sp. TaxID=68766 RepID=UPI0029055BD4|nr:conjugal transfer protein TraD [Fusobacterium sp.]MDU1912670.1 conjugal transfer protein TraD [Fusobacterium sp.]
MKDKIAVLEEKLMKVNLKLRKYNREGINPRKARAKHLIEIGALLEIAEIDQEDKGMLLGYFLNLKNYNAEERKKMKIVGDILLNQRKEDREQRRKLIGEKEIQELLELSKEKNIFETIVNDFKKKLLEELTIKEYRIILDKYSD